MTEAPLNNPPQSVTQVFDRLYLKKLGDTAKLGRSIGTESPTYPIRRALDETLRSNELKDLNLTESGWAELVDHLRNDPIHAENFETWLKHQENAHKVIAVPEHLQSLLRVAKPS